MDGLFDGEGVEWSDLARAKSLDNQKRILDALNQQNKELRRKSQLPTCPFCGGTLAGKEVRQCPHCRSRIYWGAGRARQTQDDATKDLNKSQCMAFLDKYVGENPNALIDDVMASLNRQVPSLTRAELTEIRDHAKWLIRYRQKRRTQDRRVSLMWSLLALLALAGIAFWVWL